MCTLAATAALVAAGFFAVTNGFYAITQAHQANYLANISDGCRGSERRDTAK